LDRPSGGRPEPPVLVHVFRKERVLFSLGRNLTMRQAAA
jgi:hypothetical protein